MEKGIILSSWREAVINTLEEHAPEAMGSRAIADYAIEHGYVESQGKTPWQTVNRVMREVIYEDPDASPIVQVTSGRYKIRTSPEEQQYDPAKGWGAGTSTDNGSSRDDAAAEIARIAEVVVGEKLDGFLQNADSSKPNLAWASYKVNNLAGVRVKASFGQGTPADCAHMTFTLGDQEVQNGIYIVLLYYRADKRLVLSYGLSETNEPSVSWPAEITEKYRTIRSTLGYRRYGFSYLVEVYDNAREKLFGAGPASRTSLQDQLAECLLTYWELMENVEDQAPPVTGQVDPVEVQDAAARTRQALKASKNIITVGVAGVGKTHMVSQLNDRYEGRIRTTVFHPSTSYEEFVRGLRPSGDTFEPRDGLFIDMCNQAIKDPNHDYLLVIDEINRANTAAVLGDLLMVLESSKRLPVRRLHALGHTWEASTLTEVEISELNDQLASDPELAGVDYVYSAQLQTPSKDHRDFLVVPDNLHILGTMNSTDRSVGRIDLALRRRFQWNTINPMDPEELIGELSTAGLHSKKHGTPVSLIRWWANLNQNLEEQVGPDALIGHSYFFTKAEPIEICTAILEQLSEIAQTFMITEEDLEHIQAIDRPARWDSEGLGGVMGVRYVGRGIGRRPQVFVEEGKSASFERTMTPSAVQG
ncbi:McrB family protein [Kocuria kalidii]|uniref:McrB family protein n=1 Tax=Kocuria kalidii TaxID=3376283 RepID=UPI00378ABA2B